LALGPLRGKVFGNPGLRLTPKARTVARFYHPGEALSIGGRWGDVGRRSRATYLVAAPGFVAAHGFRLAPVFAGLFSSLFAGLFSGVPDRLSIFGSTAQGFFAAHGLAFCCATAPVRLVQTIAQATAATVRTHPIIATHPPSRESILTEEVLYERT
jgi:hypothetical protein